MAIGKMALGSGGSNIISIAEMATLKTPTEIISGNTQPTFNIGAKANRVILTTYIANKPYTAINFNPTTGVVYDDRCWYRQTLDGAWTESNGAQFSRTSTTVTFTTILSTSAVGVSLVATVE